MSIHFRDVYREPLFAQDMHEGYKQIFWGTTPSVYQLPEQKPEKLRSEMINFHFETKMSQTLRAGKVFLVPNPLPLQKRSVLQLSIQALYKDFSFVIIVASTIFSIFFLFTAISAITLRKTLEKYAIVKVKANINYKLGLLLSFLGTVIITTKIIFDLLKQIIPRVEKAVKDKWIILQDLERKPHNPALASSGEDSWVDVFSQETLSKEEVCNPKILNIGPYMLDIKNGLKLMLSRNHCENGEIPHPIEMRKLSSKEQEKFLEDVSDFFCITEKNKLLDCWNIEFSEDEVDECFIAVSNQPASFSEDPDILAQNVITVMKGLTPWKRAQNFLALLPQKTIEKHFTDFVESFLPDAES